MLRRIKNLILHRQPAVNNLAIGPWLKGNVRKIAVGGAFSPADLFANGEQGVWYDPSDFSTMFQDSAGTIPVTAVGQPVGKILDKSGNDNHIDQPTAARRPLLQQDGNGKYYLSADGVDEWMTSSSIPLAGLTKFSAFHGVTNLATSGWLTLYLTGTASFAAGTFGEQMPRNGQNGMSVAQGDVDSDYVSAQHTGTTAGVPYIKSALYDLTVATRTIVTRINGTENGIGNRAVIGTLSSKVLQLFANGAGGEPASCYLYYLIIRGASSTAQEVADTETWGANKTGVTLP
jgi:hypothetical protein